MELTIVHLFPDFMSLYGEYANLSVLCRHLEQLGVSPAVRPVTVEDLAAGGALDGADMLYMGAGTERGQKRAMESLGRVRGELAEAAERGTLLLFTGNAMEILGASVTDAAGRVWPGLALAEYTTVETERRTGVDVVAEPVLWQAPAVGFMNKCSVTRGITSPLFRSLPLGFGNEADHGPEGYVAGSVFATHITGPVLVKNPEFLDLILRRLLTAKGWEAPEHLPVLPHEREAYQVTLKELQARIGKG